MISRKRERPETTFCKMRNGVHSISAGYFLLLLVKWQSSLVKEKEIKDMRSMISLF